MSARFSDMIEQQSRPEARIDLNVDTSNENGNRMQSSLRISVDDLGIGKRNSSEYQRGKVNLEEISC
jgi:hypothetical protein